MTSPAEKLKQLEALEKDLAAALHAASFFVTHQAGPDLGQGIRGMSLQIRDYFLKC